MQAEGTPMQTDEPSKRNDRRQVKFVMDEGEIVLFPTGGRDPLGRELSGRYPYFRGKVMLGGVEHMVSLWEEVSKAKKTYFKGNVVPPQAFPTQSSTRSEPLSVPRVGQTEELKVPS